MSRWTLTPKGWDLVDDGKEIVDYGGLFDRPSSGGHVADGAGTNNKLGMTASERELSKKLLHTQSKILFLEEKVDKIETVIEAGLIAHGSSTDKA